MFGFLFDLASDHSCCQLLLTEYDRRNMLLTIIVSCVQQLWYDGKVEQEARQLHIAVTIALFSLLFQNH